MFKDYDKYLKTSLKVYLFVLVIIFIMKLVGLDYFGLDVNNSTMIKISDFLSNNHFGDIYYFITLYIEFYLYLCMACNKPKLYKYALVGTILNFIFQIIVPSFKGLEWLYNVLCISIMIILPMVVNKKFQIKKQIKFIILLFIYELISLFVRNVGVANNYNNFLVDAILNLDQLLLLTITYNLVFMKGGINLCGEILEVGFYLQKKMNLKNLLKRLQTNLHNFKKQTKENKIAIIIYLGLSLIWNIFTIFVVLLIATLNRTFIECIFILTSFWLSKRVFGKAFHLSSMIHCFIVSNLTYYALNRITTPLGISIFIPIALGVGLSYVTSKFVKKTYKPLYKGMPKELFEETILKVVDKDSKKYQICYDFYILNQSDLSLSFKYNYSVAGIRKIKDRINAKIKELS